MSDVNKEIALKVTADTASAQKAFGSAREELKKTQKQLVDLALAGKQNTAEFRQLETRAGELRDAIGDVNQRINTLANDTPKLQLFGEAVKGVAAGFSIAQGAAALFGDENADLQKAILRVQASMALLNGVQEVANLLNKDSALMTQANAMAQRLLAASTGTATGALKLFRLALIGIGIGAVVVAIGALVANWDKLTKAVMNFINASPMLTKVIGFITDGFTRLGRAIGLIPSETVKATKQMIKDLEAQLKLLEAAGANTYAIEKRLAELRVQLARETGEGLAEAEEALTLLTASELKKRSDARDAELKKEQEARKVAIQKARDEHKKMLEDLNAFLLDMEFAREAARKKQAENDELAFQDRMKADAARRMKESEAELQRAENTRKFDEWVAQQKIDVAKGAFQAIADLSTAFAGQSEEQQKRAFEIQKIAGIAQTTIDTFISAQAAFRSLVGIPFVGPILATTAAATAIAAGLARVRQIKNTTFQSASTSAAPQAIRPAGIPTAPQPSVPNSFNPNITNPNAPPAPGPQGMGQQGPLRAYVVDRDIVQAGQRRNRLRGFAGL